MALPPAFVAVLLVAPSVDGRWQHNPTHFWLVAAVAFANVALALRIAREAYERADARLLLVALSYTASAAFFGVHALATPQVLATGSNAGFALAMPAGLLLAAVLAVASSIEWSESVSAAIIRRRSAVTMIVLGLALLWLYSSVNEVAPLGVPIEDSGLTSRSAVVTWIGAGLYLAVAVRYYLFHRARPSPVTLALVTSFVLLAEALVIVDVARPWQLTWWTWHLVVVAGYGYVAYAAYIEFRREGRPGTLFSSIALSRTVERLRVEFRRALEELVTALDADGAPGYGEAAAIRLGEQYGLTAGQTRVLEGAADALAGERRRAAVLAAMADISRRPLTDGAGTGLGELAAAELAAATGLDVVYREYDGLDSESTDEDEFVVASQGRRVGTLHVAGGERDDELIRSYAGHLGMAMVNLALYGDLRRLFGRYISPEIASRLLADPASSDLGGSVVEMTVLFADLRGFTTYTERIQHPGEVVELLNRYFSAAVPIVLDEGGTVDKFVGDALMAVFNTPVLQPDHALRAVRAARRMQQAVDEVAGSHPDWPRFRIGINTGSALIGNIGSDELRNFTAIGDAVNVASRLESAAEPGQILMGSTTYQLVQHAVRAEAIGALELKGKAHPVEAYRLIDIVE
jgi:class 3 adenylate cyclase